MIEASNLYVKSHDEIQLYLNRELLSDAKGVVVIVHGLCEHQGRYDYVAQRFHEAGYSTYRFDHRGHGKSEGRHAHLDTYDELLDDTNYFIDLALEENPHLPIFVYGHSMGGFAVSLWGAKYPDKPVCGIISNGGLTADRAGFLNAVPIDMDPNTELENKLGDGVCSVEEVRQAYEHDELCRRHFTAGMVHALRLGLEWFSTRKSVFSYPVLLTHGELDGIVSPDDTHELFKHISSTDKQMKIYGNLCHEVHNEYAREEVIDDYIAWLDHRA